MNPDTNTTIFQDIISQLFKTMPSLCNNVFTILYILLKKRKLFCWKYIQSKCDLGEDTFVYFFHSVYEAMIYHDHMRISIQYTFEGTYIYEEEEEEALLYSILFNFWHSEDSSSHYVCGVHMASYRHKVHLCWKNYSWNIVLTGQAQGG